MKTPVPSCEMKGRARKCFFFARGSTLIACVKQTACRRAVTGAGRPRSGGGIPSAAHMLAPAAYSLTAVEEETCSPSSLGWSHYTPRGPGSQAVFLRFLAIFFPEYGLF